MRARSVAVAVSVTAVVGVMAAALWPSTGAASPADGPYLRLEGGGLFPSASVANSTGGNLNFKPSDGPIGGGAIGLRLAPFRLEIDSDWMRAKISGNSPALSGHMQTSRSWRTAFSTSSTARGSSLMSASASA